MPQLNSYEKISTDMHNIENNTTGLGANLRQEQPVAPTAMITHTNQIHTLYAPPPQVGPYSTEMNCPNCRCRIKTRVTHRSTSKTHIACLLLSWTLCCCCLPYCMDSCRNANHTCPQCGTYIGTYSS